MLAFVLAALLLVPLEADIAHKYIVRIVKVAVNKQDLRQCLGWLQTGRDAGLPFLRITKLK